MVFVLNRPFSPLSDCLNINLIDQKDNKNSKGMRGDIRKKGKKDISAFPTKKQFRSRKASSKLAIGIVTPMELGECRRRHATAAPPPPEYTAAVLCNPNIMQKQIDSALHSGM